MNTRSVMALGAMSLCLMASMAGIAGANVVADFTDGNDDMTYVDAYHGVAGNGWKSAWVENQILTSGDSLAVTNLVSDANPVASGGNYLGSSVSTSVVYGASASYATSRDYTDGIDLSVSYQIEFTVRIDEDIATFDEYHDRYVICDGDATAAGTGTINSWSILAHGAAGAAAHAGVVGKWAFYNGNNNGTYVGTDPTKLLDTGIALTAGGVYNFTITVDPNLRKWSGTVSDGLNTYTQSDMGWRTSASLANPYLVFGTKADLGDETRAWSIDSVTITQVPGPPPVYVDTVAARFNAGATDTEVDGYPGMAGLGWGGPWQHTMSSTTGVTGTVEVLSSNPLKPGDASGNYVQVTNTHTADKTYSGFCRNYKVTDGGIDWTKEHTIQFSIRIDEDLTAGNFTTQDDRYHISNVGGTKNTDTTASWMVTLVGGEGTYADADDVGEWIFYDGNRDSGAMDVTRTVSSDMTVVSGTVYDFTIVVDPETQSYVGSVTDGINTFTSGTLGWRRSSTEIGANLMFDTRAGGVVFGDERKFSLDNVVITQSLVQIPGDANGDGYVDATDAATLATNWGTATGATWAMGDFNGDGKVNAADAALLTANWNPAPGESAAVPEPSALVLLVGGLLGLVRRSRRSERV